MPSPFPGMDPFLESPEYFPGLHADLCFCIQESLQGKLPEPYYAKSGRRVWVEYSQRSVYPDVNVLRHEGRHEHDSGGGVAVAAPSRTEPVVVTVETIADHETTERFIEIYTGRGQDKRLVSAIEVLSPANKVKSGEGRDLYLRKQREMLRSDVHLVEIDLLRGGEHVTAVPRSAAWQQAGPFDYHICSRRFDQEDRFFVYPIQLREPLPEISIPLLPADGEVTLDLQEALDRAYDTGPYAREIDYRQESPVPPLTREQREWAEGVLAARRA